MPEHEADLDELGDGAAEGVDVDAGLPSGKLDVIERRVSDQQRDLGRLRDSATYERVIESSS